MLALLEHTNCGSTPASALAVSNEANSVSIDVQLGNSNTWLQLPGAAQRSTTRFTPAHMNTKAQTPRQFDVVYNASQWQEGEQA
jgi:hypothetical protein